MRRELAAGLLALAAAAGAVAAPPCILVFGQGRNSPAAGAPDWDELNARFNAAVAEALEAPGRRTVALTASAAQIDPASAGLALLQQADAAGCITLAETTVFTDGQDTLVLRLRVYPLLPQFDGGRIAGLRIGAPLFVTQRELAMATLARLQPERLAAQMAAEYLQHDRR